MKHVGDRLREIMRMRGINATTMSQDLHLGKGHISNIMTGRIQSPKKHLPTIANYLQVSQAWLLTGEGSSEEMPVGVFPVYEITSGVRKQVSKCGIPGMLTHEETYGVVSDSLPENLLLIVSSALSGDGFYLVEDEPQGLLIARRIDQISHLEWTYLSATSPVNPSVIGKIEAMIDQETYTYD